MDHGTDDHGDAVDFLRQAQSLSIGEAIREFKRLAGIADQFPVRTSVPSSVAPTDSGFDWRTCVSKVSVERQQQLADWRGYSEAFVAWLHRENLVGLFEGERIAFPVHDGDGKVVGCHYRRDDYGTWRYHPAGTKTRILTLGSSSHDGANICV